jgi:hypothetical protein
MYEASIHMSTPEVHFESAGFMNLFGIEFVPGFYVNVTEITERCSLLNWQ